MAKQHADKSNRFSPLTALLVGLIAALSLLWAIPALAAASDYCVAPKTGCTHDVPDFETALDQADNNFDADQIYLGAATYTAPTATGYTYAMGASPVEIIGAGEGQTILTSPAGGQGKVFSLVAGSGSSIHDLTIRLPENVAGGFTGFVTYNDAERIEVVEDPTQSNTRTGIQVSGGATLQDATVTLDGAQNTQGVRIDTSGGSVKASTISARVAAAFTGGGTIDRSRLTASGSGIVAYQGTSSVKSSLIRAGSGPGITATNQPGANTSVAADGVTVIGSGTPNTFGAVSSTYVAAAQSASIDMTNSIIRGFPGALKATGPGPGTSSITAAYSDYDPSANVKSGVGSVTEANVTNVGDAGFVDPANGDYHLLSSSPLVDTGDPGTTQGTDLDGNQLVTDGDSDGIERRDMGAFEFQAPPSPPPPPPPPPGGGTPPPPPGGGTPPPPAPDTQAPTVSGFHATPKVIAARTGATSVSRRAHSTRFAYTLSEDARVRLTFERILPNGGHRRAGSIGQGGVAGANSVAFRGKIGKRMLRAGRYRVTITAIDGAGNHSAPRLAGFRIAAG